MTCGILLLVGEVEAHALEDEFLRLRLHPGGDERRQVLVRLHVEIELVVHQLVGQRRGQRPLGQLVLGQRLRHAARAVDRAEQLVLLGVPDLLDHGSSPPAGRGTAFRPTSKRCTFKVLNCQERGVRNAGPGPFLE